MSRKIIWIFYSYFFIFPFIAWGSAPKNVDVILTSKTHLGFESHDVFSTRKSSHGLVYYLNGRKLDSKKVLFYHHYIADLLVIPQGSPKISKKLAHGAHCSSGTYLHEVIVSHHSRLERGCFSDSRFERLSKDFKKLEEIL